LGRCNPDEIPHDPGKSYPRSGCGRIFLLDLCKGR
jgi:hypothetical protein